MHHHMPELLLTPLQTLYTSLQHLLPSQGSADPTSSNTRVVQNTRLLVKVCVLISRFMAYQRQKRLLKN